MARTIVKTFEVFEMKELSGIARKNAIEATSRQAQDFWGSHEAYELVRSMEKAANTFGLKITSYSLGLFDSAEVVLDSSLFDQEQAEYAIEWIREHYKKGQDGSNPFTGCYFDCYFFDFFGDELESTPDTILEDIESAIGFMLERAIDSAETDMLDEAYMADYARDNDFEFTADGDLYHGE